MSASAQRRAPSLSGALAIAEHAGWQIDRSVPIIPPPFRNYLHIAAAELLLVPSMEPSRGDLDIVERGSRIAQSGEAGRERPCTERPFLGLSPWLRLKLKPKHLATRYPLLYPSVCNSQADGLYGDARSIT